MSIALVMILAGACSRLSGVENTVLILRLHYQESLSSSALKWLARHNTQLRRSGNLLMLAGVEPHVKRKLPKAGLLDSIGHQNVFPVRPVLEASLNEAIDAAEGRLHKLQKDAASRRNSA